MKKLLNRFKPGTDAPPAEPANFFATVFSDAEDTQALISWTTRAGEIGAKPFDRGLGTELFAQRWGADRYVAVLSADDLTRMSGYFEFVQVAGGSEVIGQDELADYMVVVLEGTLAVDRIQPLGGRARLAEAHPGDMLGEMSLFDAGARFSSCTATGPCTLGVLDAHALDRMVGEEPRLAVALLASLSRRLSLRLRQVSARLSALLSRG